MTFPFLHHPGSRSRANGAEGFPAGGPEEAFTLVELLVVTAIVSILAGLLLSTFNKARQRAITAGCMSNLKQQGVALTMYCNDCKHYPLGTSGDGVGTWQQYLLKETTETTFLCPQSIKAQPDYLRLTGLSGPKIHPHYGYNQVGAAWNGFPDQSLGLGGDLVPNGINFSYTPIPAEGRVVCPAEMIAIGDSAAYIPPFDTNLGASSIFYIVLPYIIPSYGDKAVGDWHNDGAANMLLADGHVKTRKQLEWTARNAWMRSMWNNDHSPHSNYWAIGQ